MEPNANADADTPAAETEKTTDATLPAELKAPAKPPKAKGPKKRKTPKPKILAMPKIAPSKAKGKKVAKTKKAKAAALPPPIYMPELEKTEATEEDVKVEEKTVRFMALNSLVMVTFGQHTQTDVGSLGRLLTRLGVPTDVLVRVAGEDADRFSGYGSCSQGAVATSAEPRRR